MATSRDTADSRQSRRGDTYVSRSGGNLYLKVGPEGKARHLFDLTPQDCADIVAALRDVLGDEGL